jgi:hypothetical protein
MDWKEYGAMLLKAAELPPKPQAGSPMRNEDRTAMDEWAREYNQEIINALNKFGDSMNSTWCKIDPQTKKIQWNLGGINTTFDYGRFANELKACLRAVAYGQHRKNYAFATEKYLEDAEYYVRDMMRNSTASNVFADYLKK